MEHMDIWNALKTPPANALKKIEAGRLKGKSDINPQWRIQAMTEQFGPCGLGWCYSIDKLWADTMSDGQVVAHALVSVQVNVDGTWSERIPGIGGNMLVEQESKGLHVSDEGYKMAVTDALSVALKALGMAADVYLGQMDTKYNKPAPSYPPAVAPAPRSAEAKANGVNMPSAASSPSEMTDKLASIVAASASIPTLAEYLKAIKGAANSDVTIRAKKFANSWPQGIPLWELYVVDRGYVTHWLAEKAEGFGHDKACEFLGSLPEWIHEYAIPDASEGAPAVTPGEPTMLKLIDLLHELGKTDAEIAKITEGEHSVDWIARQCENALNKLAERGQFIDGDDIKF